MHHIQRITALATPSHPKVPIDCQWGSATTSLMEPSVSVSALLGTDAMCRLTWQWVPNAKSAYFLSVRSGWIGGNSSACISRDDFHMASAPGTKRNLANTRDDRERCRRSRGAIYVQIYARLVITDCSSIPMANSAYLKHDLEWKAIQ